MMKTYTSILLLSCLWLVNCNPKEKKLKSEIVTKIKVPLSKLEGIIVWKKGNQSIKLIKGEEPRTLLTGFKIGRLFKAVIRKEGDTILCVGQIKKFGDLNQDGVPEFLFENVTSTPNQVTGFRYLIDVNNTNYLELLESATVNLNKEDCESLLGSNEEFEYDSLSDGGPFLIINANYGIKGPNGCEDFQKASAKSVYKFSKEDSTFNLTNSFCPIENNTINLAAFYNLSSELSRLNYISFNRYSLIKNLTACAQSDSLGIIYLEKLAGIKLEGGTATKRTDLMPAIENEFLNVNPSFIAWTRENLIPEPDKKQNNGLTYKFLFDKTKYDFRSYALVRLLIEQEDKEALLLEYFEAKATINNNSPNKDAPGSESGLIWKRLDWANEQLEKRSLGDIEDFTIYGFWMRRMLDGSEPEIWKTLQYILKMYDEEWYENISIYGMTKIDSSAFYKKRAISGIDNIIKGKEAIPEGILTETKIEYIISARNGKVVKFNKTSNSTDMEADYSVYGYWVPEQKILVSYSTMDSDEKFSIDINNGERSSTANYFYPSKDGLYMAERTEELDPNFDGIDYIAKLRLTKKDGTQLAQYTGVWAQNGFWVEDIFYFENNQRNFLKIGKVGFNEIQPYTSPLLNNPIKTDSIPPNTEMK